MVRLLTRWAVTWAKSRQQQNKQLIKLESIFGAKVVIIDCVHPLHAMTSRKMTSAYHTSDYKLNVLFLEVS